MPKSLFFGATILILIICSCSKESFITSPDARVNITDSVKFDTVFTTTGSITKSFKVFNDNDQKLLISKIRLMGGGVSSFNININGTAANEVNNIEIAANDSIYVFVTVSVDPTTASLPFIISDSILISYNSVNRFVQLQAYGQNANFLNNTVISGNIIWDNALPYVILGGIRIDTTATLNISAGAKVYLHADAAFIVDGTLLVSGTKDEQVVFTGDRLDEPYRDYPASWPGIYIRNSSKNNLFTFTIIKNAYRAIVVQGPSTNTNPKLELNQVIIDNAYETGLLSINSFVRVSNSLVTNCGNNIVIQAGGTYDFTHCTITGYSTHFLLHSKPVLSVADYAFENGAIFYGTLDAVFRNCIFWGDNNIVENELSVNKQGPGSFSLTLDHTLFKAATDPSNTTFNNVIRNADPVFDSIDYTHNYFDFRTNDPIAPGIDNGIITVFPKDLDDNPRNIGAPDLGAYEKQ